MSVDSRRQELIEILTKQIDYLPVKNLANLLNVSIRTIHKDIASLEILGFVFEKKPGYGIYLKNDIARKIEHENFCNPQERRLLIMQELLFGNKRITIQTLSDKYYVSVSSIIADLQYLRNNFTSKESAKLMSDISGTYFSGSEEEIQKLYMLFNDIQLGNKLHTSYQCDLRSLFAQYYDKKIVDACISIVESFKDYTLYSVAQHYIFNVSNTLIVLVSRLREDYHHTMTHMDFNVTEIMNLNLYLIAKDLLEIIKDKLSISYHEADVYYLSIYLQANRIRFTANAHTYEKDYDSSIHAMIEQMGKNVGVNLSSDEDLYNNLSLHITHMKYRLDHHIVIHNPLLKQIKSEFRLMFDLTWLVLEDAKEKLQITLDEHEVGFLMLHFQTALDKAMKCQRVLVVCPNGYTTSNFIINRIRRILPPLDILEAASIHDIDAFDLQDIDMIISTVQLDITNIPVIIVSSLITDIDIENISSVYAKKMLDTNKNVDIKNTYIKDLLERDMVFVNDTPICQQNIIDIVCEKLYDKGITQKGFKHSILEREKMGGTAIASMAAIPHGDLSLVNKTQIAIWVNKVPVTWGKYPVKVIIFFCLRKVDLKMAKHILEDIFSLIETKQRVEKQISVLSEDRLFNLIVGGK